MWTWIDAEKTAAFKKSDDDESVITCGVNIDPLYTLLAEGLEPEPYKENA